MQIYTPQPDDGYLTKQSLRLCCCKAKLEVEYKDSVFCFRYLESLTHEFIPDALVFSEMVPFFHTWAFKCRKTVPLRVFLEGSDEIKMK